MLKFNSKIIHENKKTDIFDENKNNLFDKIKKRYGYFLN